MRTLKSVILCSTLLLTVACVDNSEESSQAKDLSVSAELFKKASSGEYSYSVIYFSGESSQDVVCETAVIDQFGIHSRINITPGLKTSDNETLCFLSRFSGDFGDETSILVTYKTDAATSLTYRFPALDKITQEVSENTVLRYEQGRLVVDGSINNSVALSRAQYDYSGAAVSIAYILRKKFGVNYTEHEVMEGLLEHGESESIVQRRGFSLLDMKLYLQAKDYSAAGYRLEPDSQGHFDEPDLESLNADAPFIVPVYIHGTPTFAVVHSISTAEIVIIHPHLGYIRASMAKQSFNALLQDGFIIFLVDEPQAITTSQKRLSKMAVNDI